VTPSDPDFDELLNRRDSESFKWREYAEDVLPLFVADMDFRSPEPVARALRAYVDGGVFGYPRGLHTFDVAELPEVTNMVVERMAQRYGWVSIWPAMRSRLKVARFLFSRRFTHPFFRLPGMRICSDRRLPWHARVMVPIPSIGTLSLQR